MIILKLKKNKFLSIMVSVTFFLWQSNIIYAQAVIENTLPQNPTTVVGSATYNYSGNALAQTSTTDKTVTDWNGGMNVGKVNTWNIVQPGSGSVWLNRDVSGNPSAFWGAVNSNGRVFLENANGVFFGASSHVDVNGLVASTLHISNNDFLAGNYKFYQNGASSYVVNQGNIHVANGGYVTLLSNAVDNSGSILAPLGRVALAGGEKMTVGLDDSSDISVTIDKAVSASVFGSDGQKMTDAVRNSGSIQADGGKIILTSKVLNNIFDYAVNNSGVIQANSIVNKNGVIKLTAEGGDVIAKSGSVISAKAGDATSSGGSVKLYSTENTIVKDGATIDVSGGSQAGDGGTIDVSAINKVYLGGNINTSAVDGYIPGSIIIDPADVTFGGLSMSGGTLTLTASTGIIISGDIYLTNATFNLWADNTSGYPLNSAAWADGSGAISDAGGYTIFGSGTAILNMQAGSGIGTSSSPIKVSGLSSVSSKLNPTQGSGGVYISNSGARVLNISSLSTRNGDVVLSSTASSINLSGALSAGTGIVTLNSAGSITEGSAPITASILNVNAVNNISIGSSSNQIDTFNASSSGKGNIEFTDNKTVVLNNVTTNNGHIWAQTNTGNITAKNVQANNTVADTSLIGDVFVNTYNGNVNVNNVTANTNGTAHLQALNGSIIGQNTSSTADVTAKTVVLYATKGINGLDANNALRTQTSNINAVKTSTSVAGDINIDNVANGANPLTLTSFTPAGYAYGVANNNGNINIQTNSSLVTAKDVQTPKGNVNLTTTGANSDITVNGGVYGGFGTGGFGNIALNSGGNVIQSSGSNPIKSTGIITINAGKSVSQVSGSILADAANFVAGQNIGIGSKAINTTVNSISANAGGLINLNQTGDVIINNLTSNADTITFNDSGKVNVGVGGIHSNVHDITLNTAGPLTLNGDVDAGEGGATITLHVASGGIQQNSGSVVAGNLLLVGNGDFILNDTSNDVDILAANVNGSVSYTDLEGPTIGAINGVNGISTNNHDVVIHTNDTLILNNDIAAGTGTVTLDSSHGVDQVGGSVTAGSMLLEGTGEFSLTDAGNDVETLAANVNGSLSILDSDELTIGTVSGSDGITTNNGNVNVNTGGPVIFDNTINAGSGKVVINGALISNLNTLLSNAGTNKFVLPLPIQLSQTQVNTFDPVTSIVQTGPVFLYHPLTQLNSGAFDDQFNLDEGAYDFIDDEILKKKKKN